MAGRAAELAEIAGVLLQTLAEVPLPEPIDGDAGEHRILRSGQPIGKCLDAAFAEVDLGGRERPAGLHRLILLGPLGIAAGQDVALLRFAGAVPFHGPEGRQGASAASSAAATRLVDLRLQILVLLQDVGRHDLLDLVGVDAQDREIIVGDLLLRDACVPSPAFG